MKKKYYYRSYVSAKLIRRRPPRRNYYSFRLYRIIVDGKGIEFIWTIWTIYFYFYDFWSPFLNLTVFFLLVQLTHLRINFGVCLTSKLIFCMCTKRRAARVYASVCDGYMFIVSQMQIISISHYSSLFFNCRIFDRTSAIGHLTTFT